MRLVTHGLVSNFKHFIKRVDLQEPFVRQLNLTRQHACGGSCQKCVNRSTPTNFFFYFFPNFWFMTSMHHNSHTLCGAQITNWNTVCNEVHSNYSNIRWAKFGISELQWSREIIYLNSLSGPHSIKNLRTEEAYKCFTLWATPGHVKCTWKWWGNCHLLNGWGKQCCWLWEIKPVSPEMFSACSVTQVHSTIVISDRVIFKGHFSDFFISALAGSLSQLNGKSFFHSSDVYIKSNSLGRNAYMNNTFLS